MIYYKISKINDRDKGGVKAKMLRWEDEEKVKEGVE